MNKNDKITKEIKQARLKLNLTQTDVAEKMGMNANYYARIERGEEIPSLSKLKKLAKLLKIKSLDIFSI